MAVVPKYHVTVTGAVPETAIESVELPPTSTLDGVAVGWVVIAAGKQTLTVTSALVSVDVQELLTAAWYVVVDVGLTEMLAPDPTFVPPDVSH
jgi:hypothetical protein